MVIVEGLSKVYGDINAVKSVSFAVKPGDIFGFIGPNGAGKTTTLKCIMGLAHSSSGQCTVLGENSETASYKFLDRVGFVSSEDGLPQNITARKLLELTCKIKGTPFDRIDILAQKFELPLNRKIKTLSQGNKKKAAIINAICTNPKVLILDEPTNGLDPMMQQAFFQTLKEEAEKGCAIIFSTHILSDVQKVCTKIGIIKDGQLVSVEEGENFKVKQVKNVSFETENTKANMKLIKLDGAKNITEDGNRVSFEYNGSIKDLITYLNSLSIVNLEIKDVEFEKLFMRYYQ